MGKMVVDEIHGHSVWMRLLSDNEHRLEKSSNIPHIQHKHALALNAIVTWMADVKCPFNSSGVKEAFQHRFIHSWIAVERYPV